MTTAPLFFKAVGPGLMSFHGGTGKWTVGRWRTVKGDLKACENGLHFCTADQLVRWLSPVICSFEPAPGTDLIEAGDKMVCRKGRIGIPYEGWNERTMRLFACDCAEHVLSNFEERYPEDKRPREAIAVARRFANGEATAEELAAAYSAAHSADSAADSADSAAHSAAHSAERSWQTARLMSYLGVWVPV